MVFSLFALWWRRIRSLWKLPDGRDRLRGKLGLVLMDAAILGKSLIQFPVDGWSCVPSLLFTWDQTMVEVMKIMATSFIRSHASPATLKCPQPCSRLPKTHASAIDSWTLTGKSGSVSCEVTAPFSWILVHIKFCLCPPRVYFPVLCKFWKPYGGVNGDLLKEGLCHTHVCCTQSLCPLSSPLLTCTSSWDTQTQFCLSLCGVSGSWCIQGLFESTECLWKVWGWF